MYDTIIIGGGVSGLMAAVSASDNNKSVLIIEKNNRLGKKLIISGGGRCNVTNNLPYEEIIKHIPGNGKFLYGPFSIFDNQDIIQFIESHGVPLKEEDHGRMFPVSNKAKDVLNVFLNLIAKRNVKIHFNSNVTKILTENGRITGVVDHTNQVIEAHNVIVAAGGCSVPKTGSTGDGHRFANELGHTVTELFATEVPIVSHEPFIQSGELKGLSLKDVALSVLKKNGKPRITHQMDMIFTHFGLSGPAALRCSQFIYKEQISQKKKNIQMMLDFFPEMSKGELEETVNRWLKENKDKSLKNVLKIELQDRLVDFMLRHLNIDDSVTSHHLSQDNMKNMIDFLKDFTFEVHGTKSIEEAFVTGGGIHLKEITPQTMESKLVHGLYFCGEVLDIHGYTGGYNITSALVTGYVAGHSANQKRSTS